MQKCNKAKSNISSKVKTVSVLVKRLVTFPYTSAYPGGFHFATDTIKNV